MKKGLMFYIGFLLLLLFGAALIMFCILLFSPGTTILGFKYFSNSGHAAFLNTTDASQTEINLGEVGKYSKIKIECGYAHVKIQKSNEYEKNSVVIVNNSKGFVLAKDEVAFQYSVTVEEGNVLSVKVTEPTAFLYFSSDIQIVIHLADKQANPFSSTEFEVTTTSGNITFGGNETSPYAENFNVGGLTLKTNSGEVVVNKRINYNSETKTQTFSKFNLNIGKGRYTTSANNVVVNESCVLQSDNGKYTFANLKAPANSTIKTNAGRYDITNLNSENFNVECQNGYFYLDNVTGNLTFPASDVQIATPHIEISKITGDINVISGAGMNLNVVEINGNANVNLTSGNVNFGKENEGGISGAMVIRTEGGSVKVNVKDANDKAKRIVTKNGNVEITMLGQVLGNTYVETQTGTTSLNFMTGKAYTFNFARYSTTEPFDMSKVHFKDFPNLEFESGRYVYNEGATSRGTVEVYTDANVNLALVNL